MKIIATKAQRHQGFTLKKTFCVTLCLCVLVAIFIVASHDAAPSPGDERKLTQTICAAYRVAAPRPFHGSHS
jgi:hypothetical protein